MKRVMMLLCFSLALLSLSGNAAAYTAEIAYYFQGLDVNTGTIYTDPMTFIILPVDEVEQILKPPAGIAPQFDPAVDFFVEYDPATDITALVFLPKAENDPERITTVLLGDETFEVDFSGGTVALNLTAAPLFIFHTAGQQQVEVLLSAGWMIPTIVDPPVTQPIPEPGSLLLMGLGLFGIASLNRKMAKHSNASSIIGKVA